MRTCRVHSSGFIKPADRRRAGFPVPVFDKSRGVWEIPISEEHVAAQVDSLMALCGAMIIRLRERIPVCHRCGKKIGKASQPGIPDRLYILRESARVQTEPGTKFPIYVFVELKRPGGKHRPAQEMVIGEIRSVGGIAFFAESEEQVVKELAAFGVNLIGMTGVKA